MTTKPHLSKRFGGWVVSGPLNPSPEYWPRHQLAVEWSRQQWQKEKQ